MTMRSRSSALRLAAVAAFTIGVARVRTDDPVSSNVRFTGDIVRILDRRCAACHSDDGLAMPLTKYGDVRSWGRAIREEVVEQRMPPSGAARGYGHFKNDLSLSAREVITLLSWIDGGMPRGDDRDLPPPRTASDTEKPDLTVPLPPQHVAASIEHDIRRTPIDVALDPARPIARIAIRPGTRSIMRGALVFEADEDGRPERWLGGWLPWQPDASPPAPNALALPRHARLIVELHYRGGQAATADRSSLEIYYEAAPRQGAPDGSSGGAKADQLAITAGQSAQLDAASSIWAIVPSPGKEVTSIEVTARQPDGAVSVLLWVPRVTHDWPQMLIPDRPVPLPKGTIVSVTTTPVDPSSIVRLGVVPIANP